jgi:hypothetical protein
MLQDSIEGMGQLGGMELLSAGNAICFLSLVMHHAFINIFNII